MSGMASAQIIFPLSGGQWRWGGGVAEHESRPLGNWQSDNAVDIMANAGTLVVAPITGKIVRISGSDPRSGPRGTIFGRSVTIQEPNGREWFFTHLDNPFVTLGQFVQAGAPVSRVGDWGGNSHLHVAVNNGNPQTLLGGTPHVSPTAFAGAPSATAASGAGCATMLLVQLLAVAAGTYEIAKVVT